MRQRSAKLAFEVAELRGLMNVRFAGVIKGRRGYAVGVKPRVRRTIPFVSKATRRAAGSGGA